MTKTYENESPWNTQQSELIYMIGILGTDWTPGMSDEEVKVAYESAINPPLLNADTIGELWQ